MFVEEYKTDLTYHWRSEVVEIRTLSIAFGSLNVKSD